MDEDIRMCFFKYQFFKQLILGNQIMGLYGQNNRSKLINILVSTGRFRRPLCGLPFPNSCAILLSIPQNFSCGR